MLSPGSSLEEGEITPTNSPPPYDDSPGRPFQPRPRPPPVTESSLQTIRDPKSLDALMKIFGTFDREHTKRSIVRRNERARELLKSGVKLDDLEDVMRGEDARSAEEEREQGRKLQEQIKGEMETDRKGMLPVSLEKGKGKEKEQEVEKGTEEEEAKKLKDDLAKMRVMMSMKEDTKNLLEHVKAHQYDKVMDMLEGEVAKKHRELLGEVNEMGMETKGKSLEGEEEIDSAQEVHVEADGSGKEEEDDVMDDGPAKKKKKKNKKKKKKSNSLKAQSPPISGDASWAKGRRMSQELEVVEEVLSIKNLAEGVNANMDVEKVEDKKEEEGIEMIDASITSDVKPEVVDEKKQIKDRHTTIEVEDDSFEMIDIPTTPGSDLRPGKEEAPIKIDPAQGEDVNLDADVGIVVTKESDIDMTSEEEVKPVQLTPAPVPMKVIDNIPESNDSGGLKLKPIRLEIKAKPLPPAESITTKTPLDLDDLNLLMSGKAQVETTKAKTKKEDHEINNSKPMPKVKNEEQDKKGKAKSDIPVPPPISAPAPNPVPLHPYKAPLPPSAKKSRNVQAEYGSKTILKREVPGSKAAMERKAKEAAGSGVATAQAQVTKSEKISQPGQSSEKKSIDAPATGIATPSIGSIKPEVDPPRPAERPNKKKKPKAIVQPESAGPGQIAIALPTQGTEPEPEAGQTRLKHELVALIKDGPQEIESSSRPQVARQHQVDSTIDAALLVSNEQNKSRAVTPEKAPTPQATDHKTVPLEIRDSGKQDNTAALQQGTPVSILKFDSTDPNVQRNIEQTKFDQLMATLTRTRILQGQQPATDAVVKGSSASMPVPAVPMGRPSPNVDTPMDQSLVTPRYVGPPTFPKQSYPKSAGHKEPSTAMIQHDHAPRDTHGGRNRGMSLVPVPMSQDHSSRHMNANPPPPDQYSRPPWRTNPPSWNQPPMDWRGSHMPPPPDGMYQHPPQHRGYQYQQPYPNQGFQQATDLHPADINFHDQEAGLPPSRPLHSHLDRLPDGLPSGFEPVHHQARYPNHTFPQQSYGPPSHQYQQPYPHIPYHPLPPPPPVPVEYPPPEHRYQRPPSPVVGPTPVATRSPSPDPEPDTPIDPVHEAMMKIKDIHASLLRPATMDLPMEQTPRRDLSSLVSTRKNAPLETPTGLARPRGLLMIPPSPPSARTHETAETANEINMPNHVFTSNPNSVGETKMNRAYTLYFTKSKPSPEPTANPTSKSSGPPVVANKDKYLEELLPIFTAETFGEFFGCWMALRRKIAVAIDRPLEPVHSGQMVPGTEGLGIQQLAGEKTVQLFVKGVKPVWEDPKCANGGRIVMSAPPEDLDLIFFKIALDLVAGCFDTSCPPPPGRDNMVLGIVQMKKGSLRPRLDIWLGSSGSNKIGSFWAEGVVGYLKKEYPGADVFNYKLFPTPS